MAGKLFEIQIKNLNKVLSDVRKNAKEIKNAAFQEVLRAGTMIESDAKVRAPVNFGVLRSSIYSRNIKTKIVVGVRAKYAAFVEFGTKKNVKVPVGYQAFAKQFVGGGAGSAQDAFESISLWAKRKKINPEFVYPIFQKIMKDGIKPKPFFVPAIEKNFELLLKNLSKL